jgi:hypothetical protein
MTQDRARAGQLDSRAEVGGADHRVAAQGRACGAGAERGRGESGVASVFRQAPSFTCQVDQASNVSPEGA